MGTTQAIVYGLSKQRTLFTRLLPFGFLGEAACLIHKGWLGLAGTTEPVGCLGIIEVKGSQGCGGAQDGEHHRGKVGLKCRRDGHEQSARREDQADVLNKP